MKSKLTSEHNMTILSEKTVCDCGELISITSFEVLHFDSIECPNCGSDVYHAEWLYEEALDIQESAKGIYR